LSDQCRSTHGHPINLDQNRVELVIGPYNGHPKIYHFLGSRTWRVPKIHLYQEHNQSCLKYEQERSSHDATRSNLHQ
jgi:hypothetical protein